MAEEGLSFGEILREELEAINTRRKTLRPDDLLPEIGPDDVMEAVGLALSGGGIRSAAFSLGVLQALNQHGVIEHIDYMSTVSGGGYTGAALTATMSKSCGEFVFGTGRATGPKSAAPASDIRDTAQVGHIRNYSNYLIPFGFRDAITGIAIVLRGISANIGLLLPVILVLAAATISINPTREALTKADFLGIAIPFPLSKFTGTIIVAIGAFLFFFLWALVRSIVLSEQGSEFRRWGPTLGAICLIALAIFFSIDVQPIIVGQMFEVFNRRAGTAAAGHGLILSGVVGSWITHLVQIATPITAVVVVFRQQFGEIFKISSATSFTSTKILAIVARAAVWIAGLALPLLIWIAYIYLCFWGTVNSPAPTPIVPPAEVSDNAKMIGTGVDFSPAPEGKLDLSAPKPPIVPAASEGKPLVPAPRAHAPGWMKDAASLVNQHVFRGWAPDHAFVEFYALAAAILWLIGRLLKPNANSLHRLYRDRISKAFLFDPFSKSKVLSRIAQERDFAALDSMSFEDISVEHAPYHIINAALNVQGSDYANRRGRNADFFIFTPRHIGSDATGYSSMEDFIRFSEGVDLGTAIAISGAAASSNMGVQSIKPLTPTLALLNVRLGYWLRNPRYAGIGRKPRHRTRFYLWSEITGQLVEDSDVVYLTDGGHLENLGVFELLRRRCRLIIVVDAEADFHMRFPSFIAVQRYARIDLGVRIDLPWKEISDATTAWMGVGAPTKPSIDRKPSCGPHISVGTIDYGADHQGYLVYVKASLTGDESDYVRDYARRYGRFPHETTGDQFFNEEQFEVYRALGFHMMFGFLDGRDQILVSAKLVKQNPLATLSTSSPPSGSTPGEVAAISSEVVSGNHPALRRVRELLGLPRLTI